MFWVALAGPREPAVDAAHRAPPAVRRAAAATAKRLRPRPRATLRVLAIRPDGSVARHLLRRWSPYRMATSVCEHGHRLVLGSLLERGIAVCALPASHQDTPWTAAWRARGRVLVDRAAVVRGEEDPWWYGPREAL